MSVCALKKGQRLGINPFVQTIRGSFVQQIELSADALSVEEVYKLFSMAFERVCAFEEVQRPQALVRCAFWIKIYLSVQ
jgi:hypothetical protein